MSDWKCSNMSICLVSQIMNYGFAEDDKLNLLYCWISQFMILFYDSLFVILYPTYWVAQKFKGNPQTWLLIMFQSYVNNLPHNKCRLEWLL